MNRAERRRQEKQGLKAAHPATYTFTLDDLKAKVRAEVNEEFKLRADKLRQETSEKAIQQAMILLFTLPMIVLKDSYWKKTYRKKIPEFLGRLLDLYAEYDNGNVDLDQAEAEMWRYAGIKIGAGTEDRTEDIRTIMLDIPEIGKCEAEIDETIHHGFRYTIIIKNPLGDNEAVCYGFSESELRQNIAKQLKLWKETRK